MVLNTLIGWRAYLILDRPSGGSGESSRKLDRFARKLPLRQPRGHQGASFLPSVPHARTHGHDDKPWPAGLRGTSKYFEKVIVDGKPRSIAYLCVFCGCGPGQPFRAPRRRRRFKPTRASTERRSLLAQARIRTAASRAQEYLVAQLGARPRVRDRDVHARRVR